MTRIIICISVFLVSNILGFGQGLPENGPVFLQNEVATIKIQIHPDSLEWILQEENLSSNHEFPATFIYQSGVLTDTVENIGFRLRGNTSRNAAKKSFKVSFNTFESRKWQGFEKLNLNGQQNDVSLMRTKLCWEMMREAGLPSARTSYIALYINEEYRGLYLNTEHIDENFAAQYFDNQGDGDLYKCFYPANLNYLGSSQNDYKVEVFGRRIYQLKTNTWADNYFSIKDFITLINSDFSADEVCEISEGFNIDRYIQFLALEVLQGHWDGYVYNNNNFYLYFNDATQVMEWIPYDLDNTLGIDWVGQNWTNRNIYQWKPSGQSRPLYSLVMNTPQLREKFSFYIETYAQQFFNGQWLESKIEAYKPLISSYVENDVYYTLDFGFEYEDFLNADNEAWGNQVAYGLNSYFFNRQLSALSSLEDYDDHPMVYNLSDNGPRSNNLTFRVNAEHISSLSIEIVNGSNTTSFPLHDDGVFPDEFANDHHYVGYYEIPIGSSFIEYRYIATSLNGEEQWYMPCAGFKTVWTSQPDTHLQINEVMANNVSSYLDEANEAEDWIELYNGTNANINLSSYYFTDELGNWNKWKLPSIIHQVGTFKVWWADNEPEINSFHTNFKLSNGNETLWLIRYENGAPRIIDAIAINEAPSNFSFGRETEASDTWTLFFSPTPNAPNGLVGIEESETSTLVVFPNPSEGMLYFSESVSSLELRDMRGKMLVNAQNVRSLSLQNLPNGVYVLITPNEVVRVVLAR